MDPRPTPEQLARDQEMEMCSIALPGSGRSGVYQDEIVATLYRRGSRTSGSIALREVLVDVGDTSFSRWMNCGSVCRAFETSRRREVLSFYHHEVVASAKAVRCAVKIAGISVPGINDWTRFSPPHQSHRPQPAPLARRQTSWRNGQLSLGERDDRVWRRQCCELAAWATFAVVIVVPQTAARKALYNVGLTDRDIDTMDTADIGTHVIKMIPAAWTRCATGIFAERLELDSQTRAEHDASSRLAGVSDATRRAPAFMRRKTSRSRPVSGSVQDGDRRSHHALAALGCRPMPSSMWRSPTKEITVDTRPLLPTP
jgi:hypothetical protein